MSVSQIGQSANYQHKWRSFQSTDTDGDGQLSLSEFSAIGQNVQGGNKAGNNGLDTNSLQQIFSAIDTDGSGQISRTEATTAFDKLSKAMQSGLLGVQEQFGAPPPKDGSFFASADTDKSGNLNFDEFKTVALEKAQSQQMTPTEAQIKAKFDKLDSNGDGYISEEEMKAGRSHGHRHHHHQGMEALIAGQNDTGPTATGTAAAATDGSSVSNVQSDLAMQATTAYNTINQTLANVVSKIVDTLKAA